MDDFKMLKTETFFGPDVALSSVNERTVRTQVKRGRESE
jgi:hypothetical protein